METINENILNSLSSSERMPMLFLGHGSPMNAIEENQFVEGFRNIVKQIPQPQAILCVSAHWFIDRTMVTFMDNPKTIHDFYGFPKELYEVEYPAKGHKELAKEVQKLLYSNEVGLDLSWGLDHGAWSVIKHLYPKADIPVVQLSIDYTKEASFHFLCGSLLQSLRERGVLIIGSGNIIHNLRMVDYNNFEKDNYGYDWAKEIRENINKKLMEDDFEQLINYNEEIQHSNKAIPSPDHYLPLLYILGAKHKEEKISFFNDKLVGGSLSMTSLFIQ
ncbi:MAG: dioxygenase extradiol [Bacteroidetes bacterium]|nr:dioxygenase extradiol [Bacteroidota bacterium]